MYTQWARWRAACGRDVIAATVLFLAVFAVFRASPVGQVGDSNYSMLLSETLLTRHTFALDAALPVRGMMVERDGHMSLGDQYPLVLVDGHIYYFFPPGSSILSVPFIAVLRVFGYSTMKNGVFDPAAEIVVQRQLAAFLMATFVVLVYVLARHRSSVRWSLLVAVAIAFGTSVWSTASRAMWSDTWGLVLMMPVVILIVRSELHGKPLHPVALGALLAVGYVVRPTAAVIIVVISAHLLTRDALHRRAFGLFCATLFIGIGLFSIHSIGIYGTAFPPYFATSRLGAPTFWEALPANLVSPGRGLFVYSSFFVIACFAALRARRALPSTRLVAIIGAIFVLHLLVISSFPHWWGGYSYGPRFCTALVPWLALLCVLAIEATRKVPVRRIGLALGGLALVLSISLHASGALAVETWRWNERLDATGGAGVWSWKHAQFLAPLQKPEKPPPIPLPIEERIAMGGTEASPYLGEGWSGGEDGFRWTNANVATIVIGAPTLSPKVRELALYMKLSPYVPAGRMERQRLAISIDDVPLVTFELRDPGALIYMVPIPRALLHETSVLRLQFPDAVSPATIGESSDPRALGAAFQWIDLKTFADE